MYKKYTYFLCLLLLPMAGFTQVTMSVQIPPTGVLQKSQLWNLLLVSTSTTPVYVTVQVALLSTLDNNAVMMAVANPVLIKKGTTQLTINELGPVQYNYLSSAFNVDRNPNGFLPMGNFQACYSVSKVEGEASSLLAEECLPLEVAPLSPPMLNSPFDKDTISGRYPQFTWLPPTPMHLFNGLTYNLVLVKVQAGQSDLQAIQQNLPLYSPGNLREPHHFYPPSGQPLDTAHRYAWRILASNHQQLVGQSEVWSFFVAGDTLKKQPATGYFIALAKEGIATGVNTLSSVDLGIKYYSYDSNYETMIKWKDSKGDVVRQLKKQIVYGDNYFTFTLDKSFKKGEVYKVLLTDLYRVSHTASFILK